MSNLGKTIGIILIGVTNGVAAGLVTKKIMNNQYTNIQQYSSKIANKDINRFNRINNAILQGEMKNSTANWMKEYNKMMDSLKLDSIAKKSYFEGAQMVRDSIKVVTKLK